MEDVFKGHARLALGAELLDLTRYHCRDGTCPVVIGGATVSRDLHHLDATNARTSAAYAYRDLVALGALPAAA